MENELIQSNISFLKDYIPKLVKAIENVVDLLIKNDERSALDLLEDIIEGLEWGIRSISSIEKMGYIKDLNLTEMNRVFLEIEKAFHRKDFVLLGDLLQYEVSEELHNWLEKLNHINGV